MNTLTTLVVFIMIIVIIVGGVIAITHTGLWSFFRGVYHKAELQAAAAEAKENQTVSPSPRQPAQAIQEVKTHPAPTPSEGSAITGAYERINSWQLLNPFGWFLLVLAVSMVRKVLA